MTASRRRWVKHVGPAAAAVLFLFGRSGGAQTLRYDSHRKPEVPDYATVRVGPFYSDWTFNQYVGYRYVRTSGTGAQQLFDEEYGGIQEDGSDFPLESTLNLRNYVILGPHADLELSMRLSYKYFPMDTQEDDFSIELAEEGAGVTLGDFSFRYLREGWTAGYDQGGASAYASDKGRGLAASFDSEIEFTPYVKGTLYDSPAYRIEYVDARGATDFQGGQRYEVFQNIVGFDVDWLVAKEKNMALSLSRTDTIPQDEEEFGSQRSAIHQAGLAYEQQIDPNILAGARSGVTHSDYLEAERGNQFQHEHEGFTVLRITDLTMVNASLGYAQATLLDAGPNEDEGTVGAMTGQLGLRTQLAKRLWHSLGLGRSMGAGYSSGVDVSDDLSYMIYWAGEALSAELTTSRRTVSTELTTASGYSDWTTQAKVSRPLTKLLTVYLSSAYSLRDNDPVEPGEPGADDETIANDYDTWTSLLGAVYAISERTSFSTYVQRASRYSDAPDLEFDRDTLGAGVALTYQF